MRTFPTPFVAALAAALAFTALVGCGSTSEPGSEGATGQITGSDGEEGVGDVGDDGLSDGPIVAVDDTGGDGPESLGQAGQGLIASTEMRTTGNLNLRKGPGTSHAIITVIPSGSVVTLVNATPTGGFLNVTFSGTTGWSSAAYLVAAGSGGGPGPVDLDGPASPDNALARAKTAIGFSYFWGGSAWLAGGASPSTAGSCSGSCPSCTHSGKYGADCSGLISKAWQFGAKALEVSAHPYTTVSFNGSSSNWSTVSRSSLRKGDALVYNSGGAGHIVMYEKGDGWGTPTVVECRGCSYGCVYNARSFTSNYKGIRRTGF